MDRTRKVLRSLVVIAALGGLATLGAFSAFTSKAENPGNRVQTGTVTIADNDGGTALYNITNGKPGDSQQSCTRVNYTGSLPADVRIYRGAVDAELAPHVNLLIEAGTQAAPSFPSCNLWIADLTGSQVYSGTLSALGATYAAGTLDHPLRRDQLDQRQRRGLSRNRHGLGLRA